MKAPNTHSRETHQSGLPLNIFRIRSRPHAGIQRTRSSTSRKAASRKGFAEPVELSEKFSVKLERARPSSSISITGPPAWSIEINHCGVARKITGFLQRQQCG